MKTTPNPNRPDTLAECLTRQELRELAGSRSFERGVDYYETGRAKLLDWDKDYLRARVSGTRLYKASISVRRGELEFDCSCPVGQDGNFCKHLVAAGLAWLNRDNPPKNGGGRRKAKPMTAAEIRAWLETQDKKQLIEMILTQAADDEALDEALRIRAARGAGRLDDLFHTIDRTLDPGDFVDYRSMDDFARRATETIRAIRGVLNDGHAAAAIELAEHALRALDRALGNMDDSDGQTQDLREELMDIHYEACRQAKPEPTDLARRLFEWELNSEWDTFYGAIERYHDILGEKGLAAYRQLAEKEWAKIPALQPGARKPDASGHRFQITGIMERLAKVSGSLDEQIAVMSRDLSNAYEYLQIAETCQKAGDHERALEWAEKGLKAFPQKTDGRLREFVAREYHRRRRHAEAVKLLWLNFTDHLCLDNYAKLKASADKINAWQVWREQALSIIRKNIQPQPPDVAPADSCGWNYGRRDASLLVEILIWEKDYEAAWREAKTAGCSNTLWLKLAHQREA